jgi:hypothetical protein
MKMWTILPIIGDGTRDNPFRVKLPERLVTHPVLNIKVNELAVSWVAIIPTGEDGKPIHKVALVLVGTKSDYKIKAVKDMIETEIATNPEYASEARKHVPNWGQKNELTKEEARIIGKRLDPKLPDNFVDIMDVAETP